MAQPRFRRSLHYYVLGNGKCHSSNRLDLWAVERQSPFHSVICDRIDYCHGGIYTPRKSAL